jgi:hypothetical protein
MLALAAVLLAASGTASAGASDASAVPRVLVLETRADEAYVGRVQAFGDLLATILEQESAAEIVPATSVRDRLALAAEKVQAGCDDVACMTEIAGALDARYVVASRASQVGGRWLMRTELFDSQDLKVVAQTSVMSDSIEGLAAQAEAIADDLLRRAPMIPRRGSVAAGAAGEQPGSGPALPPPDARSGLSTPWVVGGLTGAAALVTAAIGIGGFFWAAGDERRLDQALVDYQSSPSFSTRRDLAEAGVAATSSSVVQNCFLAPIGCLCIPLGGVALGSGIWALTEKDPAADEARP